MWSSGYFESFGLTLNLTLICTQLNIFRLNYFASAIKKSIEQTDFILLKILRHHDSCLRHCSRNNFQPYKIAVIREQYSVFNWLTTRKNEAHLFNRYDFCHFEHSNGIFLLMYSAKTRWWGLWIRWKNVRQWMFVVLLWILSWSRRNLLDSSSRRSMLRSTMRL